VIATGFKQVSSSRHRHQETRASFAATHDSTMDFPEALGPRDSSSEPRRDLIMERQDSEDRVFDRAFEDRGRAEIAEPVATTQALDSQTHRAGEVISLDAMRGAMMPNFEQDDLDVPAFMRKRSEVM
jgi:hypothetical protein